MKNEHKKYQIFTCAHLARYRGKEKHFVKDVLKHLKIWYCSKHHAGIPHAPDLETRLEN